jgi:acetyl-CoA acetyltransferase
MPLRIVASQISSGVRGPATTPAHAVGQAATRAFVQAGLGPWDMHLAELHDATAPAELELYAQLGMSAPDEAGKLVRDGITALGGALPVNVSGGLLGRGHPVGATGLAQIHELALHLRGRAGARQVAGAAVGLAQNSGGWMAGDNIASSVTILAGRAT